MHELRRRMAQSRREANFTSYLTSSSFQARKEKWPAKMKASSLRRENWWMHPDYHKYPQMPEFHIHFRVEMGNMLAAIYDAYSFHKEGSRNKRERRMNLALNIFEGSMSTLSFHVSIEERRVFPMMQHQVNDDGLDLSFLYDDHKNLHMAEERLMKSLKRCLAECVKGKETEAYDAAVEGSLHAVITHALEFDTIFLNHLGEEEEVVVPITLLYGVNF